MLVVELNSRSFEGLEMGGKVPSWMDFESAKGGIQSLDKF